MITDFHTHSFPDKIAAKSMAFLVSAGGLQPYRDGTLGSLKQTMKTDGIDRSVGRCQDQQEPERYMKDLIQFSYTFYFVFHTL